MRERGIIFNAEMVRAVLSGSKTQTRRIITPQPFDRSWSRHDHQIEIASGRAELGDEIDGLLAYTKSSGGTWHAKCPFGQPGDRLWVRETFMDLTGTGIESTTGQFEGYAYRTDTPAGSYGDMVRKDYGLKWTPSIHMPRKASRITLEITGVRVERLNSINENDAMAEGLAEISKDGRTYKYGIPDRDGYPGTDDCGWPWHEWERYPISAYCKLWSSIYGEESWQANPWVWAIEFKRVEGSGND
jgi:hypothetical protein